MTRQTQAIERCFQQTAQTALKNRYGFAPHTHTGIKIYDGNGRTDFKFEIGGKCYQFKSHSTGFSQHSPDRQTVWAGGDTITEIKEGRA